MRRLGGLRSVFVATAAAGLVTTTVAGAASRATWTQSAALKGGPVYAIASDPTSQVVYAGTRGGVFRSADGGGTWSLASAGLGDSFVDDIALDPNAPQTVYAATEDGVFKSVDGATTWRESGRGLESVADSLYDLVADGQLSQTVYVSVVGPSDEGQGGVFRTSDGGASWSRILKADEIDGLAADARFPQTLYAGGDGVVYKTSNGGQTWSRFTQGLPDEFVVSLAVDPQGVVFAGTTNGIYKSSDGGQTWLNADLADHAVLGVAIDPSSPQTVWAGTPDGVFRSSDGGTVWNPTARLPSPVPASVFDVDVGETRPGTVLAGTGNGVFSSADGTTWSPSMKGLTAVWVRALAADPKAPTRVYVGTHRSGMLRSSDRGSSWTSASRGLPNDVSVIAVDPKHPSTIYVGTPDDGVFKSTNGGSSWAAARKGLPRLLGTLFDNIYALAIDPKRPSTVYAGTAEGLYQTTNSGRLWTRLATTRIDDEVYSVGIDPKKPGTVYVGTKTQGLFTTNGGATWRYQSAGLPNDGSDRAPIFTLAVDPRRPQTIYAGTADGVYKSTNAARSWKPSSSGLPLFSGSHAGAYALVLDPKNPGTVYAGTFYGVFRSTRGLRWQHVGGATGDDDVAALAIDSAGSTLYAGTEGGGVYSLVLRP